MTKYLVFILILLTAYSAQAASTSAPDELKDLYFGEALYSAFQEEWFDAISRLDTELGQHHSLDQPELDSLFHHFSLAEFAVGDFELAYRMHRRAGRAITEVINGDVEHDVRNEAIYRLAKIYFQKDQPVNALHALERISPPVAEKIRADLDFLIAQVLMANGRYTDAVDVLMGIQEKASLKGFVGYNLGIALMRDGQQQEGRYQLDLVGQINSDDPVVKALKDKANLFLGEKLLEEGDFNAAKRVLDRVRIDGPFSSQALLKSGWADASLQLFDRALVPWNLMLERQVTDSAVQEALLAAPYAYGKLGIFSKAALLYGSALDSFGAEIDRLDESIELIREGHFLEALVRDEVKSDANWAIRLRELPETPETYYLLELLASHEFQQSLHNYLDLERLLDKLERWQLDLDAYEELIEQRKAYYQPLIPAIDNRFRQLDSLMRLRLEQRERIAQRLQSMLVAPRPDYLATAEERIVADRIDRLEETFNAAGGSPPVDAQARVRRLRGLLLWKIRTDYDTRLTETYSNLHALDQDIEELRNRYNDFVRVRQAATQSFQGYNETIRLQRMRIAAALTRAQHIQTRQGRVLEDMAVDELTSRREHLLELQVKARFAMADSYDRAVRAEAEKGESDE